MKYIMNYMTLVTTIAVYLAGLTRIIYSSNEELTDDNGLKELFDSDMFKFLANLEDEHLMEEENTYMGKANENTYCYTKDSNPYQFFSTKTHYPIYNESREMDPAPGCEISYVWLVMRHGIRYGSARKMNGYYNLGILRDKIIKNAGEKRTDLCTDDIFSLLLWMPFQHEDNQPIQPETLTENGYQLVKKFGKKLKDKFPHLIPKDYDEKLIQLDYSNDIKTNQSIEAMVEELFGKKFVPRNLQEESIVEQLYPQQCRRPHLFDKKTGQNYTYLAEISDYTVNMIKRISDRLGFEHLLSYREIANMYDGCQYEIAWGRQRSSWCAVFTKEDLKIMEYISDIAYFYLCGPGDVYSMFQGCILLKDLFNNLKKAAEKESPDIRPKMSLYMGHSTTVLLLISQLGLTKGEVLLHNNYYEMADRKWKTSHLAPYTGNIMAILQKCSTGERNRVKFLVNEKPITFGDACGEDNLCSFKNVYELFEPVITNEECSLKYCDHSPEEMCKHLNFGKEECEILKIQYKISKQEKGKAKAKSEEEIKIQKDKQQKKQETNLEQEYQHAYISIIICIFATLFILYKIIGQISRILTRRNKTKKLDVKINNEVNQTNKEAKTNKEKSAEVKRDTSLM
ncbi:multiple inositol polyphosphate phosphatase 1-like isoform X4 [Lycorma delicatula]|uniref:multiple inositol polyphosphate phosphatase 1-like isoform X4 n=1 Tax=Lycorma delicatula TaxID=130591 RepID=UPI003F515CEE